MELYQLRYFLAVAETASFSRAAERVFVTQPTLSAGIKKLEQDLGCRLLERSSRRVGLTAAGERLLARARVIQHEANAARNELTQGTDDRPLAIGALRSLPAARLAALLRDFTNTHGDRALRLRLGTVRDLDRWLAQGRVDIAITTGDALNERPSTLLFRRRLFLFAAPDFPLAKRGSLSLAQLNGERLILRSHCEFLEESQKLLTTRGIRTRVVCRTDSDEQALALAAAGIGFCVMPGDFSHPGTVRLPIKGLGLRRAIGLAWPADPIGEPARQFHGFASSHPWTAQADARLDWAR